MRLSLAESDCFSGGAEAYRLKIRTSRTSGLWAGIDIKDEEVEAAAIGGGEVARHLSQAIRATNLVIASGPGTSPCVRRESVALTSTMGQLHELVCEGSNVMDER